MAAKRKERKRRKEKEKKEKNKKKEGRKERRKEEGKGKHTRRRLTTKPEPAIQTTVLGAARIPQRPRLGRKGEAALFVTHCFPVGAGNCMNKT